MPGAKIFLKLTITPHPGTRKPLRYGLGKYAGWRKLTPESGQPIVAVIDLSEYGVFDDEQPPFMKNEISLRQFTSVTKVIIHPDFERGGEYRVRVENLNPVALPEGIATTFSFEYRPSACK